jgi:hypothetical protein
MAEITTINTINSTGLASLLYTASATSGGDKFPNTGNLYVSIKNDSSETRTVTFTTQVTSFDSPVYGPAVKENSSLVIAAGRIGWIGPFSMNAYNDTDGNVNITYTSGADILVAICVFQK